MDQHIQINKINHEILLLKTVKNLKQKSDESEEKLKVKDAEIEQLKELNAKKDEKLIELNKKIEQNEDEIKNLKTFAERTSQLHLTLSDKYLQTNVHHGLAILQDDYEKYKEVHQWNKLTEEVNKDLNYCCYLQTLKESINRYKKTIYSTTYKERIINFCFLTPPGVRREDFLKISCLSTTEYIQIEQFDCFEAFQQCSVGKVLFQNYGEAFTYYVGDCLHVVLYDEFRSTESNTYLFNDSDEYKKLILPNKEAVEIYHIWKYLCDGSSIVLYLD